MMLEEGGRVSARPPSPLTSPRPNAPQFFFLLSIFQIHFQGRWRQCCWTTMDDKHEELENKMDMGSFLLAPLIGYVIFNC